MDKLNIIHHLCFSSFKGCFLGGLFGDVLGRPFEGQRGFNFDVVQKYFDTIPTMSESPTAIRLYSDDTVMTIDLSQSMIEHQHFVATDMAKRFAKSCISSFIDRYYGGSVTTIFVKWMCMDFHDVWDPAKEQFNGQGSFGNGAAMRVSPVGLIALSKTNPNGLYETVKLAIKTSQLTHTHPLGIGGAIFQAVVVRKVVETRIELITREGNSMEESDEIWETILNGVETDLLHLKNNYDKDHSSEQCESGTRPTIDESISPYLKKMGIIRDIMKEGRVSSSLDHDKVVTNLGNGIAAIDSVPTALFCFLAAFYDVPNVKVESHFQRAVQLAITLGGDTDTIASMTGSICGSYLGVDKIPSSLQKNCEGVDGILKLAEAFFEVFYNREDSTKCKF